MQDTAEDREAFAVLMRRLGALFNREITAPLIRIYWQHLADLDLETVQRGFVHAERREKFFPLVATLREHAGVGEDSIGEAVAAMEAIVEMRSHDPRRGTVMPSVDRVADEISEAASYAYRLAGGPMALRSAYESDDLTWFRKDFISGWREGGRKLIPNTPRPLLPVAPKPAAGPKMFTPAATAIADVRIDHRLLAAGEKPE